MFLWQKQMSSHKFYVQELHIYAHPESKMRIVLQKYILVKPEMHGPKPGKTQKELVKLQLKQKKKKRNNEQNRFSWIIAEVPSSMYVGDCILFVIPWAIILRSR